MNEVYKSGESGTSFMKTGYSIPSLQYLVCGVEAMSRAVRLGHVQNTHLPPTGL